MSGGGGDERGMGWASSAGAWKSGGSTNTPHPGPRKKNNRGRESGACARLVSLGGKQCIQLGVAQRLVALFQLALPPHVGVLLSRKKRRKERGEEGREKWRGGLVQTITERDGRGSDGDEGAWRVGRKEEAGSKRPARPACSGVMGTLCRNADGEEVM